MAGTRFYPSATNNNKKLDLSQDVCVEYIYGDTKHGLFSIPVAADNSDIVRIDTAFKLLTSPDEKVETTAWEDLRNITEYCQTAPATFDDMAKYLSKQHMERQSTGYNSVLSAARDASGCLNIAWNLSDAAPSIIVGENAVTNRRLINRSIRAHLQQQQTDELKSRDRQGKTHSCYHRMTESSHAYTQENISNS